MYINKFHYTSAYQNIRVAILNTWSLGIVIHSICFLMFSGVPIYGQDSNTTILSEINHASASYKAISQLLEESENTKKKDWRKSLDLAKKVYAISKEEGYDDLLTEALLIIGESNYYHIDQDGALDFYSESYKYAQKLKDNNKIYQSTMKLGEWHMNQSKDEERSQEYFEKAIEAAEKTEDHYAIGKAYAKIATLYTATKDIEKIDKYITLSTENFLKANDPQAAAYHICDIGSRLWDYDMNQAVDYYLKGLEYDETHYFSNLNIGKAYIALGLPETAIPHLALSLDSLQVDESRYGIANNLLADAYTQMEQYPLADSICNFNIQTYTTEGSSTQNCLSKSYLIKGKILELKNKPEEALAMYETSYAKAIQSGSSLDKTKAKLALGEYHLKFGNLEKARNACKLAYEDSLSKYRIKLHSQACGCLFEVERKRKSYDAAFMYLDEKNQLDKLLNENTAIQKLDVFAKLSLREKEIVHQKQLNEEQLKSQRNSNFLLRLALACGLIFILILFRMLSKIKKQNTEIHSQSNILKKTNKNLSQSNEELERFAYIISHDLKTPMLIIVQFTKLLAKNLEDNAKPIIKESIQHIEKGGTRMMALIEDVLAFSKNEEVDIKTEAIELGNLMEEISELLVCNQNKVKIEYDPMMLPSINWNYTKILLLFKNLIENGLKYNNCQNPTIQITSTLSEDGLKVFIKDNGIGIKKEYFDKVFVMFKRLHNQNAYEGTGLGLATCKKIVNDFGGEIFIESEINIGSTFIVHFPPELVVQYQQQLALV